MEKKICKQCGAKFNPRHKGSKYCRQRCLWDSRKGHTPWNKGKGNGWVDSRGYHWCYVTEYGERVARRRHRVVMERHLKRKLEPWELVHHKDEDPSNNKIDNLGLTTWGDHTSEHSKGRKHSKEAKRSMEAFALMRNELHRERKIKTELLEALEEVVRQYENVRAAENYPDMESNTTRAAKLIIAKAYGETP